MAWSSPRRTSSPPNYAPRWFTSFVRAALGDRSLTSLENFHFGCFSEQKRGRNKKVYANLISHAIKHNETTETSICQVKKAGKLHVSCMTFIVATFTFNYVAPKSKITFEPFSSNTFWSFFAHFLSFFQLRLPAGNCIVHKCLRWSIFGSTSQSWHLTLNRLACGWVPASQKAVTSLCLRGTVGVKKLSNCHSRQQTLPTFIHAFHSLRAVLSSRGLIDVMRCHKFHLLHKTTSRWLFDKLHRSNLRIN